MLSPDLKKSRTRQKGFGIFAEKRIPKGTITCFECSKCHRFYSKPDLDTVSAPLRKRILKYSYEREDGILLFPCDDVIYINHSCNANTLGTGHGFDIAVRDIEKGEEITYDYRMFYENKWRSDDYYTKFACQCGEPNCVGEVRFIGPRHNPGRVLIEEWKRKISSSLRHMLKVDQPLWPELLKNGNRYIAKIRARQEDK